APRPRGDAAAGRIPASTYKPSVSTRTRPEPAHLTGPQAILALQRKAGNAVVVQTARTGKNRPTIQGPTPDDDFEADTTPGRTDAIVISGHGRWEPQDGHFRVPAGTRVHFL